MSLKDIYAETDAGIAALTPSCSACVGGQCDGHCCHLGKMGLTLYVCQAEVDYLLKDNPPLLRPVSSEVCAFLDAGSRCSVYANRPVACRTWYCGMTDDEKRLAVKNAAMMKLKALNGGPIEQKPIEVFLAEYEAQRVPLATFQE